MVHIIRGCAERVVMSIGKIYPSTLATVTGLFGILSVPASALVGLESSWMIDYLFKNNANPELKWGDLVGFWVLLGSFLLFIPGSLRTRYSPGFGYMTEVMFVYVVSCFLFALILVFKPVALTVFAQETLEHILGWLILFTGVSCRYLSRK